MSSKMISFLILIFMSSQVRCGAPEFCQHIITNGTFSGLRIYRHFEGLDSQNETIRVYNDDYEFEVELRDRSLKFTEIIQNKSALYKFNLYHRIGEKEGFVNCEVNLMESVSNDIYETKCTSPLFPDLEVKYHKYPNEAVFVNQRNSKYVLIFDRNDREKWYRLDLDSLIPCFKDPFNAFDICKIPAFVKEMNDSLFSQMEGVISLQNADTNGSLVLFNIDGRPKHCITSEQNLSEECHSSANMRTLFEECFPTFPTRRTPLETSKPNEDSTNSLLWIFITLGVVTVILLIGVGVVWYYKFYRKPKYTLLRKLTSETLIASKESVDSEDE